MENSREIPSSNVARDQNAVPSISVNQASTSSNASQAARLEFSQMTIIPQNSRIAYLVPAPDFPNLVTNDSSAPGEQCRYFLFPGNSHGENITSNLRPIDAVSHVRTDPLSTVSSQSPGVMFSPPNKRYFSIKIAAEMVPILTATLHR